MTAVLPGIALLTLMGMVGIAALWRYVPGLTLLEHVAYGMPLGMVMASLAYLVAATIYGPGRAIVLLTAVICLIALALLIVPTHGARVLVCISPRGPATTGLTATVFRLSIGRRIPLEVWALVSISAWWIIFWGGAVTWENGGVGAVLPIWGDWMQHVGDVASFVYGNNVPPEAPRYAGHPYAYHYLPALTAAAMTELGTPPIHALIIHTCALSIAISAGVIAFARRLTGNGIAAALTSVLFTFGGGFEWLLAAYRVYQSSSVGNVFAATPIESSNAMSGAHFVWRNVYMMQIMPQRGYLYGLPLMLLTFTLLYRAIRFRRPNLYFGAGIVAGLLPFAHLGPLLALGLVTATLFVTFPSRFWVYFFGAWIGLTLPQLALQQGAASTFDDLRWQIGWMAAPDPWGWFWLKNLGLFIPLAIVAFLMRGALPALSRRYLWAFSSIFFVANLVVFAPDPWDNAKLLTYWYLSICIVVAALVVRIWQSIPKAPMRFLLLVAVVTMIFGGLLGQLEARREHFSWLSAEDIALAEEVRALTPIDAVFATGLQPENPIAMLGGRLVVMGYPGWLWPRGIDTTPTEGDLREIYLLNPSAQALMEAHNISYVLIGPWERANFAANEAEFRARYPVVTETEHYVVFDVRE